MDSKQPASAYNIVPSSVLAATALHWLSKAVSQVDAKSVLLQAPVDTRTSELVQEHHWGIESSQSRNTMAFTALTKVTRGLLRYNLLRTKYLNFGQHNTKNAANLIDQHRPI